MMQSSHHSTCFAYLTIRFFVLPSKTLEYHLKILELLYLFDDTPITWKDWTKFLERWSTSVLEVLIFIPVLSHTVPKTFYFVTIIYHLPCNYPENSENELPWKLWKWNTLKTLKMNYPENWAKFSTLIILRKQLSITDSRRNFFHNGASICFGYVNDLIKMILFNLNEFN